MRSTIVDLYDNFESFASYRVLVSRTLFRNAIRNSEADNIYDFGLLPFEEIPIFLNSLDLAVVYDRESTFGDFCFPQKLYEILVCR